MNIVARGVALLMMPGLLLLLAGLSAEAQAADDGGAWSRPVALSGNDPRTAGWFPTIATDLYGQVHVMWQGRPPGRPAAKDVEKVERVSDNAGWLMYARQSRGTWTAARDIGANGNETDALRTTIAADGFGRLHLLYRGLDLVDSRVSSKDTEPIRHTMADALSASSPLAWSPSEALSTRLPAYYPEMVVDSHNVLHALTTEAHAQSQYTVYYHRSDDSGKTWSPPVPLEPTLAISRFRLQLKVGPADDLHAVWEVVDPVTPSGRDAIGFVYARSVDGGRSWARTTFAPPSTDTLISKEFEGFRWRQQPAVGIDGRGQIVLVWRERDTNLMYFQHSRDGRAWTAPAQVSGVTRGVPREVDRYDMATDGSGRLHLAMVAYPEGSPVMALLHSEWLGYSWGEPEAIVQAAIAPFPEWPRLAIGEGNRLHLVWFGGSLPSVDRVPTGIWYSTRVTTATHIAPRPLPAGPGANQADSVLPISRALTTPSPIPSPAVRATVAAGTAGDTDFMGTTDQVQPSPLPVFAGVGASGFVLIIYVLYRRVVTSR